MSKHNYSQYSNKQKNTNQTQKPKVETETKPKVEVEAEFKPAIDPVENVKVVKETVETVTLPATVEGVVVNCAKLNVRKNATVKSNIVHVLDAMSKVKVDVNKSNSQWVYIYTADNAEGYCMRAFIDARL